MVQVHERVTDPKVEYSRLDKAAFFMISLPIVEPGSLVSFVAELKHPGMSLLHLFCNRLETLGWQFQLVYESFGHCFTHHLSSQAQLTWRAGVEVAFHQAVATKQQSWGDRELCTKENRMEHKAQYLGAVEILSEWSPLKRWCYWEKHCLNSGSFGSGCARPCAAASLSFQLLLLLDGLAPWNEKLSLKQFFFFL